MYGTWGEAIDYGEGKLLQVPRTYCPPRNGNLNIGKNIGFRWVDGARFDRRRKAGPGLVHFPDMSM